ncbi:hypothetical protein [Sulfitobacter pacificus]|uniref:hypothetical protein n=1 Tax=Sulfitobacter pacificus TaxID=1499314 RepID=UPI0031034BCE
MEVWVEFTDNNRRISPDSVEVHSGTLVQWRFKADSVAAKHLRWTVYFETGNPFRFSRDSAPDAIGRLEFASETLSSPDGQHVGVSTTVTADKPGHYKYGVRLEAVDEEEELGDEDPTLIVLAIAK